MKITGGNIAPGEIQAYVAYCKEHHPDSVLTAIHIDGDYVNLEYEPIPFERIRRITGYLVGTTARWNKAKQAELKDRVTHGGDEPSR